MAIWPVIGIAVRSSLSVATSQGIKRVAARAVLTRGAASTVLRGMFDGAPKKIFWSIIAFGTGMSMIMDLEDAYDAADLAIPDKEPTQAEWTSADGKYNIKVWMVDGGTRYADSIQVYEELYFQYVGAAPVIQSSYSMHDPDKRCKRIHYEIRKDGNIIRSSYDMKQLHEDSVVNVRIGTSYGTGPSVEYSPKGKVDLDLEQWVDDNLSLFESAPVTIEPGTPIDAIPMGNATATVSDPPVYNPVTQQYEDPETGLAQDPVQDQDMGTLTPPPQAGDPYFDATPFIIPDKETYEEKMQEYIEQDPVGDFIDDFSIQGTGAGQVSIPLPFGEGHATLDFGMFDDIYAQLRTIILAFAYLYALFIFFKGA